MFRGRKLKKQLELERQENVRNIEDALRRQENDFRLNQKAMKEELEKANQEEKDRNAKLQTDLQLAKDIEVNRLKRVQDAKAQALLREEQLRLLETKRQAAAERRRRDVSREAIRALRESLRLKFELDNTIWIERKGYVADRDLVLANMEHSDAIWRDVVGKLRYWQSESSQWSSAERELVQDVFNRLMKWGNVRIWEGTRPWEEPDGRRWTISG